MDENDQARIDAEIAGLEAEIDQMIATFRDEGIPDVRTLQQRFERTYVKLLVIGLPVEMVLGGSTAALAVAMHRLARDEIGENK